MAKFKKDVAYDEEVFQRALEILKEKGVETDLIQIERIYDLSAKYTKKILNEEDYCAINLHPIGRAYHHLYDINKIKADKLNQYKFMEYENDESREEKYKQYLNWKQKSEDIKEEFELYRPKENVSEGYMFYHIIQNLRRAIKRRKITPQEVEKIQNNIK